MWKGPSFTSERLHQCCRRSLSLNSLCNMLLFEPRAWARDHIIDLLCNRLFELVIHQLFNLFPVTILGLSTLSWSKILWPSCYICICMSFFIAWVIQLLVEQDAHFLATLMHILLHGLKVGIKTNLQVSCLVHIAIHTICAFDSG